MYTFLRPRRGGRPGLDEIRKIKTGMNLSRYSKSKKSRKMVKMNKSVR
jgi:hypothetical protein